MSNRFVEIGKIVDKFKLDNQIKVEPLVDDKYYLKEVKEFYIKTLTGFKELHLSFDFFSSENVIFRVENVRPELLDFLKGKFIYTKYENLPKLKDNQYYIADLEECVVYEYNGDNLGKISRILTDGRLFFLEFSSFIIPFTPRYVEKVDVESKIIKLTKVFSDEKDYLK
ncbi:MAG: ribosome maturation factor RimM [Brevinematales bacterium]|nr:ribosome maturation factor RimM [Brevinematales bacterium]